MKKIIIAILFFCLLFQYAYNYEPNRLVINKQNITLNNWHKNINGLKIVVIGDLHIGTNKVSLSKLEKIIDKINREKADIVFILGDFDAMSIFYSKIPAEDIAKTLGKIDSKYGIYAVLGNHDYEPENIIEPILKKASITLLQNESTKINIKGQNLRICGIKDWWHYDVDVTNILGKINEPTIFLSHNPDAFPQVSKKVALTLSGHTHGGEVALPYLGGFYIPSAYGTKYAKGLIKEGDKTLFVTSGIASLSRFRTFNPPEIVVLNLHN